MKIRKKLLIVYFCLLGIVLVTMASLYPYLQKKDPLPPRDFPEIKEEGVLRVITEYNPSDYYIEEDTILGFQYELCQAISQLSGLEVQIHLEMNLENSFEALDRQNIDVIARNIPITSENKEMHLFTEPIILNKQVLVQRTAKANHGIEPIRNQIHLGKKRLYIPKDSPALVRIKNLAHEIGDTIYIEEDELYSDEQLIIQVAKGDIDFAVCSLQNAERMLRQYPEIDIQTDISFTQLQSWAVRKGSPILLDSLNHWLDTLRKNGIYDQIYNRYYKQSF